MGGKILTVKREPPTPLGVAPNARGEVRTEITLVNYGDRYAAEGGYTPQEQVRRLTVNAVVDTRAWNLFINEKTREKLGLRVEKNGEAVIPGGETVPCGITEYVEVRLKDHHTICEAVVVPGEEDVLLGRFALYGLNVTVNP
jgi:hypothetical protein